MNRCKCKLCGDIIISKHRHDFVRCKCGEIFTDGGDDYMRRGAGDFNNLIDLPGPEEMHQEELNAILRKMKNTSSVILPSELPIETNKIITGEVDFED